MTEHKYEIDRRYPFEATIESVRPDGLPDNAKMFVWTRNGSIGGQLYVEDLKWRLGAELKGQTITHFMVLEYPAETHTAWVNIYPDEGWGIYPDRPTADSYASPHRLACIKIEWTEGEGL